MRRCQKHPADYSSTVGVCATCLRERLFALLVAQAQAQQAQTQAQQDYRRKSDTNQQTSDLTTAAPPLIFPRSVSPYVSRCKFDNNADNAAVAYHRKFFSTPQVGPYGATTATAMTNEKKNYKRFSLFSRLFRSKSLNPSINSDPRVSDSVESGMVASSSSSSPSSWFSAILPRRTKKQMRTSSLEESAIKGHRKSRFKRDRGMSPAVESDGDEHCDAGSSGYSSESSLGWKQTPRRTPAAGIRRSHTRNLSNIAFCLSPLVRPSPNRLWNQKGVPPEVVVNATGDFRLPVKPHLSAAASFCKNRSRKLADFGRFNRNP